MKKYQVAIVGATGAVGQQVEKLLRPLSLKMEVTLFNSTSSAMLVEQWPQFDLAFFCVSADLAKELIPKALSAGVCCIDSSNAYRSDPTIPLIIPEINGHLLTQRPNLIASPNCTTTLMLLALAPLHKRFSVKRVVAATYQAVSGAGARGMEELVTQTRETLEGLSPTQHFFPFPCAFNIFPHESPLSPSGYVEEEYKMLYETQKILDDNQIKITALCTRVPLLRCHGIALNIECRLPLDLDEAKDLLQKAPGLRVVEALSAHLAIEQEEVLCGRIRLDHTQSNTLELFVIGDQLLKGAALNMVQIAKEIYASLQNQTLI